MERILVLSFSAFPGVTRLIMFLVIGLFFSNNYYVEFSNLYFQAMLYSAVIGTGFGTYALKNTKTSNLRDILILCLYGAASVVPIFISLYLYTDSYIISAIVFTYGVSFSLLVFFRFEIIKNKKYKIGFAFESIVSIGTLIIVAISYIFKSNVTTVFLYLTLYNFSLVIVYKMLYKGDGLTTKFISPTKIGFSNLSSSGIVFIIPLVIAKVGNSNLSGIVSDITVMMGIITLIPRSHTNYKIPDLILLFKNNSKDFSKELNKVCITNLAIASTGIAILLSLLYIKWGLVDTNIIIFVIIITLYYVVGQYFMPDSILINTSGQENTSLAVNTTILVLFIALCYLLISYASLQLSYNAVLIPAFLLIAGITKFSIYRYNLLRMVR